MSASELHERLRQAVADPTLEANVTRATDTSLEHRRAVVAERPDWEALRDRAARLRDHVLSNLDTYLETFARQARARGVHVHAADDAAAAREVVLRVVREHRARRVLKSKSMTTEEVGLNGALEAAGVEPLETDLGEYIVQLAGEPPSHITAPALHRSAEQIHELFTQEGVLRGSAPAPAERAELPAWLSLEARAHLRPRLLDADLGITGANFGVAESGTVVLLENEGNIRYTTTSPHVQVALLGIDKLVPRLTDLGTLLPLLTRSATGQRATAYATLLSGPLEELHVVLLDNGRTRLLADAADREVLRCVRCGACLNVCPVYRTVGGHAYGSAYPGPIGAVLTPLLWGRKDDRELPWLSSLCGACNEVCPVRIDLAGHLLRLRARGVAAGTRPRRERLAFRAWRFLASGRRRYRLAASLARRLEGVARRFGLLGAWTRTRSAPRLARPPFHQRWRRRG